MPTYEFRCPDGSIVERMFRMSEVPDQIPAPNGEGMATRIISGGAALLFKGTGFYITDYGKDGKKDQRSGGGEGKSSEGKASEGSSSGADSARGSAESKSAESKSSGEGKSSAPSSTSSSAPASSTSTSTKSE